MTLTGDLVRAVLERIKSPRGSPQVNYIISEFIFIPNLFTGRGVMGGTGGESKLLCFRPCEAGSESWDDSDGVRATNLALTGDLDSAVLNREESPRAYMNYL